MKNFAIILLLASCVLTSHAWNASTFNKVKRYVNANNVGKTLDFVNSLNVNDPGPQCSRTLLSWAAISGANRVARTLLDMGANPNLKQAGNGMTPMMYAADKGNGDLIKVFMQFGGDKRLKDNNGKNSLDHATMNGYQEVEIF